MQGEWSRPGFAGNGYYEAGTGLMFDAGCGSSCVRSAIRKGTEHAPDGRDRPISGSEAGPPVRFPDTTETDIVVAVVGLVVVAVGNARVPGIVVPRTAAQRSDRAPPQIISVEERLAQAPSVAGVHVTVVRTREKGVNHY